MSLNIQLPKHTQDDIAWVAMRKYADKKNIEKAHVVATAIDDNKYLSSHSEINDKAIASATKKALRKNIDICLNDIKIKVKEGWVTLYGEQNWNYQRDSAKNCIHVKGIKGIINNITVKSNKNMILSFMWENLAIQ
jgi:osmotically-inducible protein OsmY